MADNQGVQSLPSKTSFEEDIVMADKTEFLAPLANTALQDKESMALAQREAQGDQNMVYLYTTDEILVATDLKIFTLMKSWYNAWYKQFTKPLAAPRDDTNDLKTAHKAPFNIPCTHSEWKWLEFHVSWPASTFYHRGFQNYTTNQLKNYHLLAEAGGCQLIVNLINDEWARRIVNDGWKRIDLPEAAQRFWKKFTVVRQNDPFDFWKHDVKFSSDTGK